MRSICIVFLALTVPALVSAQCDSITVGQFDTSSFNNQTTPYPTNEGRGSKTQYLFLGSELNCLDPVITGISIQLIDSGSWGDFYNQRVTLANTALSDLSGGFHPINSTTNFNHQSTVSVVYDSITGQPLHPPLPGIQYLPFPIPFVWNGTSNVIVEFSYERSATPGVSPAVALDTGLTFISTYYGYHPGATPGWNITQNVPPTIGTIPGSAIGGNNTRPVITFHGDLSTSVETADRRERCVWPVPASEYVTIEVSGRSLSVYDLAGNSIDVPIINKQYGQVQLDASLLDNGVYLFRSELGEHGRFVVSK